MNPPLEGEESFGQAPQSVVDLASMELHEAAKYLFGVVNWNEYIRTGVFLSQNEVSMRRNIA
jgi:hypothetical protein